MESFVTGSQAIALLVTLLGCIPYGIWVIYSIFKRRWKRVAWQIGIPVAVYAVLIGLWSICSAKAYRDQLAGIYGTEVELAPAIYSYDSDRAFNGDGYSFAVYELPASIRKRFETVDAAFLAGHPKRPGYRKHWQSTPWMEAPLDSAYTKHLDFALSSLDLRNAPQLAAHFEAIRKALLRKGTYYSCFYNTPGGYVGDIDFFVVDPAEGRLYVINHNT